MTATALACLEPRVAEIISYRMGLEDGIVHTSKETALRYQMSRGDVNKLMGGVFATLSSNAILSSKTNEIVAQGRY